MNIPMKHEDVVAKLDAALERNTVLQAELEEKQAFAEMFYSKQVLAETKMRNAEGREAALREELARYKSLFGQAQKAIDRLNELHPKRMGELAKRLTVAEQRAAMLEREFKKLRDVAHGCYQIASSYSGCIDGVEEHGGDDHEDPSCAIHHRLYYAMFDADRALKPAAEGEGS